MTRSANEVMTLAAKAARGAGAPPAQAAHFGRAALCHLSADRPEANLTAALDALPGGPIIALPRFFAQLAEHAVDGMAQGTLVAEELNISYAEAQAFDCQTTATSESLTVTMDLTKPAERHTLKRIVLSDAFFYKLENLAAKLLVPESDASRLSGAGAGLTDND